MKVLDDHNRATPDHHRMLNQRESDVTAPGLVPIVPSRATRAELQTQHFIGLVALTL
jgi:hypothetical protein